MNRIPSYLKNKYTLTLLIFLIFILFLDDLDIFSIISQRQKLNQLEIQRDEMAKKLNSAQNTLNKLNNTSFLESYARSKKFFKKDDEEIFVISYEDNSK